MANYAIEECVYCGAENQFIAKESDTEVSYNCSCGGETCISIIETEDVDGC